MPESKNIHGLDALRHWLARKLLRSDGAVINVQMCCPTGWELHRRDLDQRITISGSFFGPADTPMLDVTRVMWADWRDR